MSIISLKSKNPSECTNICTCLWSTYLPFPYPFSTHLREKFYLKPVHDMLIAIKRLINTSQNVDNVEEIIYFAMINFLLFKFSKLSLVCVQLLKNFREYAMLIICTWTSLPTSLLLPYQTETYGEYCGSLNGVTGRFLSDFVQFRHSGKLVTNDCLHSANKLACHANTVKPLNKGHIGDGPYFHCREVVLSSEVFF